MDYSALTGDASSEEGKRVRREAVSESLVLRKPLNQVDHEGGLRFDTGSWEHHLLRRWIEGGAKDIRQRRDLARLEVTPREVVFRTDELNEGVRLRVVAVWEDNVREDVTPLCRFRTNDDSVVAVDIESLTTGFRKRASASICR